SRTGDREFRCILAVRQLLTLPVDHAPGAGEDHPAHPALPRALEQIQDAEDVDLRFTGRIGHGNPDVDLRSVMVEVGKSAGSEQAASLGRAHVRPNDLGAPGDVFLSPAGEIVQYG